MGGHGRRRRSHGPGGRRDAADRTRAEPRPRSPRRLAQRPRQGGGRLRVARPAAAGGGAGGGGGGGAGPGGGGGRGATVEGVYRGGLVRRAGPDQRVRLASRRAALSDRIAEIEEMASHAPSLATEARAAGLEAGALPTGG